MNQTHCAFNPTPWLQRIAEEQAGEDDPVFRAGMFRGHRHWSGLVKPRPDDNIFYTASAVWIMQQCRPHWPESAQALADTLMARAIQRYPDYRSRDGVPLFNFWRNFPPEPFPNGRLMRRFPKFILPDDFDDTSVIYLTAPEHRGDPGWYHDLAARHANGNAGWNQTALPRYRRLPTYSLWVGVRMPIEFDACVMSNLLYWVCASGLPFNTYDRNGFFFLEDSLRRGFHASEPLRTAPYYSRPAIILYHLTRLYAAFETPPNVAEVRLLLMRALQAQLLRRDLLWMDRLLLSTSMMRLGGNPVVEVPPPGQLEATGWRDFVWISASMLGLSAHPLGRRLAPWQKVFFTLTCPAFALVLMLEHETLKSRLIKEA